MNLVAKEYVACQRDGDGVLVLSEFAGAAAELGEALLVNPYDIEGTAEALDGALTMPGAGAPAPAWRRCAAGSCRHRRRRGRSASSTAWRSRRGPRRAPRAAAGRPRAEVLRGPRLAGAAWCWSWTTTARSWPFAAARRGRPVRPGLVSLLRRLARLPDTVASHLRSRAAPTSSAGSATPPASGSRAEHGACIRRPCADRVGAACAAAPATGRRAVARRPGALRGPHAGRLRRGEGLRPRLALPHGEPEFGEWLANELVRAPRASSRRQPS